MNAANVTLICRGGRDFAVEASDNRIVCFACPRRTCTLQALSLRSLTMQPASTHPVFSTDVRDGACKGMQSGAVGSLDQHNVAIPDICKKCLVHLFQCFRVNPFAGIRQGGPEIFVKCSEHANPVDAICLDQGCQTGVKIPALSTQLCHLAQKSDPPTSPGSFAEIGKGGSHGGWVGIVGIVYQMNGAPVDGQPVLCTASGQGREAGQLV